MERNNNNNCDLLNPIFLIQILKLHSNEKNTKEILTLRERKITERGEKGEDEGDEEEGGPKDLFSLFLTLREES